MNKIIIVTLISVLALLVSCVGIKVAVNTPSANIEVSAGGSNNSGTPNTENSTVNAEEIDRKSVV